MALEEDLYTKINSKEYIGIDIDESIKRYKKFPEIDFRFKNFKNMNVTIINQI